MSVITQPGRARYFTLDDWNNAVEHETVVYRPFPSHLAKAWESAVQVNPNHDLKATMLDMDVYKGWCNGLRITFYVPRRHPWGEEKRQRRDDREDWP